MKKKLFFSFCFLFFIGVISCSDDIASDKEDETEIVIRLLSFGPMLKVVAPGHLVDLIKERLINQKSCEQ